jgi:hypothetical protein
LREVNRTMDGDATAEESERLEFEGVPYMPSALEGAAYRFAEDEDFADRILELDARSKIAATRARLAPLSGWPSQEVKLARGSHEALNEADQAELAEGRRVLREDLVGKLKRGELSARGELLMRIDSPSLGMAILIPPGVWERCEVDWAESKIEVPGGTGLWIFDVVETEPRGRSAPQSSHGEPPAPPCRASGGRPVQHDWDAFWVEVTRYAASNNLGDRFAGRRRLQRHMARWCPANMASSAELGPSDATIRDKLRCLYESEGAPASKAFSRPTVGFHDAFWIEVVHHADLNGLEREDAADLQRHMEAWCSNALRDPSSAAAFVPEKLRKLYQHRPAQKRME